MHIGSAVVGAELFADTMYVGKLKGVGTVWQLTMVDGACSFGLRPGPRRAQERHVDGPLPHGGRGVGVPRGGIRPVRINTTAAPSSAARSLGPAWSSRSLHYRTAFRYRYYVSAADIDADLQAWLRYYNFERPHRGYRTAGRTPASIFYAHRPSLLKVKGWDPNELRIQARAV